MVERSKELLTLSETGCLELLNSASGDGAWGLEVVSTKIDKIELADEQILQDLESFAQATLAAKRKQVEGKLEVESANVKKNAALQEALGHAEVQKTRASAQAEVEKKQAESKAEVALAQAKAQNEIALAKATSEAEAEAAAKKIQLEMAEKFAESQAAVKRREAEAEAAHISLLGDAEYKRGCQQQEIAAMMPQQELELKRMDKIVEGLRYFGAAAWRHPDEMQRFYEHLAPFLYLKGAGAPATAAVPVKEVADVA